MSATIEPLTPAMAEPCLAVAAAVFAEGSTLHKALGIDVPAYRAALREGFAHMVAQGLSVVAMAPDGRVLGCVVMCDILDQGPAADDPRLRPMQALMHDLEEEYIALRAPAPGQSALVDMAFVRPDAAGGGLYTRLRKAAHSRAREAGFAHVVGILSSAATQKVVVTKFDQSVLARHSFAGFEFEGGTPFASIEDPSEIWLTEGNL